MNLHWTTTNKYIKIAELFQNYCPIIEVIGSKVKINKSKFQRTLTEKEKFVLYLFNEGAIDKKSAVEIHLRYDNDEIKESIGYLYSKSDNKYYLTDAGKSVFRALKDVITEIIFNEKEICGEVETSLFEPVVNNTIQRIEIKIRIEHNLVRNAETTPKINYKLPIDPRSVTTSSVTVNH